MSPGVRRFRHPGRRSLARRCPRLIFACAAVLSCAVIVACGSSGGKPDPDAARTAISFPPQAAPARTAPATTTSTPTTPGGRTAPLPGQTTTAESAPGQPKQLPPAPAPAPGEPAPPAPPPPAPPAGRAGVFLIGRQPRGRDHAVAAEPPAHLARGDQRAGWPPARRRHADPSVDAGAAGRQRLFRAPIGGHSYGPANAAMRRMARDNPRRMRLVDWEAKARAEPALSRPDRIPPSAGRGAAR